jgi:hypothetical protein
VRGYHLPKLIVPGVRVAELVANSKKTRPDQREAFYQRDLGEPYAPSENRLSLEQIRACVDTDLTPLASLRSSKLVTMGVDVASTRALNVVIEEAIDDRSGRRVFVGEIEDGPDGTAFEQLCALMDRYGVAMACIDRAPEGRFAKAFADAFPGRVYRAGYYSPGAGARGDVEKWKVDDVERHVGLWRTFAIEAMLEGFRIGAVRLPPLDSLPADYPAHLGSLVRRTVETPGGNVRVEFVKLGPDDYAHAEVYNLAALELLWRRLGLEHVKQLMTPQPMLTEADSDYDESGMPIYRPGFDSTW